MLKILLYVLLVFNANAEETEDINPVASDEKQNICIQKKQEIEDEYNLGLKKAEDQLDVDKKFVKYTFF